MDRRDFMKLAALSGLAVMTPLSSGARAEEASERFYSQGKFFIAFLANGGWDVTNFCDPKGGTMNRTYEPSQIKKAGNISYAPLADNDAFFQKYASELLIINGIDTQSNGHLTAERYMWSGGSVLVNQPTFAALYATKMSEGLELPLPYLSNGGYAGTGALLPVSRLEDIRLLSRLSNPELYGSQKLPFRSDFAQKKVAEALAERRNNLYKAQTLPKTKTEMGLFYSAQLSSSKLRELNKYLPETIPESKDNILRQIAVTLAACKAGVCISANLFVTGFDTHSEHDAGHDGHLVRYTQAVDYLWERAEALGIRDRIMLMMGSEFSRTPKYNEKNGKDHWAVGSVMFMGKDIKGNRVIGATTDQQAAMGFDPQKMKPIPYVEKEKTLRIQPQHIHKSLRKWAAIENSAEAKKFPLEDDIKIDFFA